MKKLIIVALVVFTVVTIVSTLIWADMKSRELWSKSRSIQYGTVCNSPLGVYWNDRFTSRVERVEWGSLQRGESRNATIYIRNGGNENITGLAQVTSNWNPVLAEGYINLTWDYVGYTLEPSHVESVTLTLTVNENTPVGVGAFSFDIVIFSIYRSSNAATIVSYGTLQGD